MQGTKLFNIYEGIDYTIQIEYNSEYVVFHLPVVNNLTKKSFNHGRKKLKELYDFFSSLDYKGILFIIPKDNEKINRLAELADLEKQFVYQDQAVYMYKGN